MAPSAGPLELRVMTLPCMVIENMRIEQDGVLRVMNEVRNGPWTTLRASTPTGSTATRLSVKYQVWLGGSRTIPLVHGAAVPGRAASAAPGGASVDVRFPHDSGIVEFPHMSRTAPNAWSATYASVPAFVKVGGFAYPCDRVPPKGDDGGLVWRFWLLVGIMIAWVSLYLSWARRTGSDG